MKAHIRESYERAWCGANIPGNDFAFTDADYAVKLYDRRDLRTAWTPGLLIACADCCDAVKRRAATENVIK